jgi:hypothetical protein
LKKICGRPSKYSTTMEGQRVGGAAMFKGTADLGARDGGVYGLESAALWTTSSSASRGTGPTPAFST